MRKQKFVILSVKLISIIFSGKATAPHYRLFAKAEGAGEKNSPGEGV